MKKYLLFIPIFILILWTGYHEYQLQHGQSATLKITGYDPRDLLSGHYLTYEVEYPMLNCKESVLKEGYLNINTGKIHPLKSNQLEIKGICKNNRFITGIEQFYIPEKHAKELDQILRNNQYPAMIEIRITDSGKAYVKDLFFNDIRWQEFLKTYSKGK